MKDVPFGIDDFKELRERELYYVDKSSLIEEIVSNSGTMAFLFTRPRRFGKSLNLSMIDAFFNLRYEGNTWFEGLEVMSSEECRKRMNRYPVVSISLKGLETDSYDGFLESFREKIRRVSREFEYLFRSESSINDSIRESIDRTASESALRESLLNLSEALTKFHGIKTIILIDEYDNAVNNSYGKDTHAKILSFIRDLLGNALKSNPYLQFGVVTGVMQIAKESIFSGLNNIYVNNIFNKEFDEFFGFTESEVEEMLTYYGHPEKLSEIKEWYDGYRFGNAEIYNPWSILSYIKRDFIIGSYWLNEGNPTLILESVRANGAKAVMTITDLYNDGTVDAELSGNLIFAELSSLDGLLSLLTGSGYLNATPLENGSWRLKLVNKEVKKGLLKQLVTGRWTTTYMNSLSEAILNGSPDDVRIELMNSLDISMDSKVTRDERYYQAFVLGMLNCLTSDYYVRSEYRGGKGYADIALIPRDGRGPFAVIELKDEENDVSDDAVQRSAEAALGQIEKLRYYSDLHGDIHLYGIATRQTDVFVSYREVHR